MAIRIATVVLTFAGLLALISGLLIWAGSAWNLISMHMLLGILAVAALWVVAMARGFSKGGSRTIVIAALIVGLIMIVLGIKQPSLMVGEYHWVVRVLHLALGLLTIGLGHMAAARHRKCSTG